MSLEWWVYALGTVAVLYTAGVVWLLVEIKRAPLYDENERPIPEDRSS